MFSWSKTLFLLVSLFLTLDGVAIELSFITPPQTPNGKTPKKALLVKDPTSEELKTLDGIFEIVTEYMESVQRSNLSSYFPNESHVALPSANLKVKYYALVKQLTENVVKLTFTDCNKAALNLPEVVVKDQTSGEDDLEEDVEMDEGYEGDEGGDGDDVEMDSQDGMLEEDDGDEEGEFHAVRDFGLEAQAKVLKLVRASSGDSERKSEPYLFPKASNEILAGGRIYIIEHALKEVSFRDLKQDEFSFNFFNSASITLSAVNTFHRARLFHGDISGGNISSGGQVFDYPTASHALEYKRLSKHTPGYEAPEILNPEKFLFTKGGKAYEEGQVGPWYVKNKDGELTLYDYRKADIYSLGVYLYIFWNYKTRMIDSEVIEKEGGMKLEFSKEMYLGHFGTLVKSALSHNPLERPTAKQLLKELRFAKAAREFVTPPASAQHSPERPSVDGRI